MGKNRIICSLKFFALNQINEYETFGQYSVNFSILRMGMDVLKSASIPLLSWVQVKRDQSFSRRYFMTLYFKGLQSYQTVWKTPFLRRYIQKWLKIYLFKNYVAGPRMGQSCNELLISLSYMFSLLSNFPPNLQIKYQNDFSIFWLVQITNGKTGFVTSNQISRKVCKRKA